MHTRIVCENFRIQTKCQSIKILACSSFLISSLTAILSAWNVRVAGCMPLPFLLLLLPRICVCPMMSTNCLVVLIWLCSRAATILHMHQKQQQSNKNHSNHARHMQQYTTGSEERPMRRSECVHNSTMHCRLKLGTRDIYLAL